MPFDFSGLLNNSPERIFLRYFWQGNEHALWYLCGSVIGMLLTYALYKALKRKHTSVFIISIIVLFVGCLLSTYAPLFYKVLSIEEYTVLNLRNGLFYAFPYIAMGLVIAKNESVNKKPSKKKLIIGFVISMVLLAVESVIFVIAFKTTSTVLWMSVLPCSYFLFLIVKNIDIRLRKDVTIFIRKLSTLMYLSHGVFVILFSKMQNLQFFLMVTICSLLLSATVIFISKIKYFRWLQCLY